MLSQKPLNYPWGEETKESESGSNSRHNILRVGEFPVVILVEVRLREGKAFGSEEGGAKLI